MIVFLALFIGMTIDQLPKCLFKEGTETQVEKVNNSCRTSILAKVAKYCPDEYKEVSEDPLFAQIVAIHVHKLQFSARAIHTFVCKQLLSEKRYELCSIMLGGLSDFQCKNSMPSQV